MSVIDEEYPFPDEDYDDDDTCTMCSGECYVECDDWIQCCAQHSPIKDHDGNVVGFLCACRACNGSGLAKDQTVW